MSEEILLTRDCNAIQIPYGNTITVREGTAVSITQQLGDTFTVRTSQGYLMRIDGKDADALGQQALVAQTQAKPIAPHPVEESQLWEVLKTCYDPEIPASIVELGLIYSCTAQKQENGFYDVAVQMTLTAPGCGMGQVLQDDVQRKLSEVPGVQNVQVDLVFDPPWDPTMMSEAARLQLGMM